MMIRIDQKSAEPLYLQIRFQIIAAIARGEIAAGEPLPSVRSLAQDLGINLHTVNKAYAVLRDEGFVVMCGRSGASIADQTAGGQLRKSLIESSKMEEDLYALALVHRARGGTAGQFVEAAKRQAAEAFGEKALQALPPEGEEGKRL